MKHFKFFVAAALFIFTLMFSLGAFFLNSNNLNIDDFTHDSGENPFKFMRSFFSDEISVEKPINILVLGGDKVNKNTDTIIVVNLNPNDKSVKMLSIPRDTKVLISGKYRKINYAYPKGGAALAIKTIEKLTDLRIDYYVFINMKAFRQIVDLLGGLEYYVPQNMNYDDPSQNLNIHLKKGLQILDGKKAEYLVRYRKNYKDGDISRVKIQQDFIKELVKQKLKIQNIPKLKAVVEAVYDNIETDISLSDVLGFTSYIGKFTDNKIEAYTLPGKIGAGKNYWYYICNEEKTKELISGYFKAE